MLSKVTSKFDSNGNEIEANKYYPDGELMGKWTYKYDINGNEIEENYLDGMGGNFSSYIFYTKYDKKCNEIETEQYNYDGNLIRSSTIDYIYDNQENWIRSAEIVDNNPVEIIERDILYY